MRFKNKYQFFFCLYTSIYGNLLFQMLKGIRTLILRDLMALQNTVSPKLCLQQQSACPLIIIQKYAFCQHREKINISKDEQMAVASFIALNYIILFKSQSYIQSVKSIRENLIDRNVFQRFAKDKLSQIGHPCTNLEDIGLLNQSIDQVLKGFKLNHGAKFDLTINSQDRVKQASSFISVRKNGQLFYYVTLNPTVYSSQIISSLFKDDSFAISGSKGIGKSFCYLIYTYLTSFILRCRVDPALNIKNKSKILKKLLEQSANENKQLDEQIQSLLSQKKMQSDQLESEIDKLMKKKQFLLSKNWKTFDSFGKLFYLPLKESKLKTIERSILNQASQLTLLEKQKILEEISKTQGQERLAILISIIQQKYRLKGIKVICLVDEANVYYSSVRNYASFSKLIQEWRQGQEKEIKEYQYSLKINLDLSLHYTKILLALKCFRQLVLNTSQQIEPIILEDVVKKNKFFNFYEHQKSKKSSIKFQHSSHLDNAEGQYELYTIFWYQLSIYLTKYGLSQQTLEKAKKLFIQTFKLSNVSEFIKWNYDVSPLKLSEYLKFYKHYARLLKQIRVAIHNGSDQIQQRAKDYLLDIKHEIQNDHQKEFNLKIQQFLKKSKDISPFQKRIRIEILLKIRCYAFSMMELPQYRQNNKRSFEVHLSQLVKQLVNKSQITENSLREHIKLVIPDAKIGFINKEQTLSLKVIYHPRTIIKGTVFLFHPSGNFQIVRQIYSEIINNTRTNQISSLLVGDMLDLFIASLFSRGNFTLNLIKLNNQMLSSLYTYSLNKGFKFPSWNKKINLFLTDSLGKMFQEVRKQNDFHYISGSPQAKTNQGADVIIMYKENQTIHVISFDATISSVKGKVDKASASLRIRTLNSLIMATKIFSAISFSQKSKSEIYSILDRFRKDNQGSNVKLKKADYLLIFNGIQQLKNLNHQTKHKLISQLRQAQINQFQCLANYLTKIIITPIIWDKQMVLSPSISSHHFCIPYQRMLFSTQPENITWNHIFFTTHSRLEEYKLQDYKNSKIFAPIKWKQNGRNMELSFSTAAIDFSKIQVSDQSNNSNNSKDQNAFQANQKKKLYVQSLKNIAQKAIINLKNNKKDTKDKDSP